MITDHMIKIDGKWYAAGTEIPELKTEEKPRRGRPPKSEAESEVKE